MPVFKYTAVAADGSTVKAAATATSEQSLSNELLRRDLKPVKIREKKSFTQIEITKQKVPRQEIMHFSRQCAAFVRGGIPLADAIRVVEQSTDNARMREIMAEVAQSIQAGVPFSEALSVHADVFPAYYLGILKSAELTGQLDTTMDQLATYIERDLEARQSVKSALTYPAVILAMSVVVVVVMVTFVLPRFVTFFDDLGAELPLPTRMLLGFSRFTTNWWWAILLGIVVLIASYLIFMAQPNGKYWRDRFLLSVPLLGEIVQYSAIERFCRIVASMMRAGVPLPDAMETAAQGTSNRVFERQLDDVRDAMLIGEGLAGPISRTTVFPNAAIQMMRVGEESGTLDQQIDQCATYYSRELEYKLKRLTTLFEPAVILAMGFVVGFVAVALVSAMYGIFNSNTDITN